MFDDFMKDAQNVKHDDLKFFNFQNDTSMFCFMYTFHTQFYAVVKISFMT